jgi:disulfide bond formation protein DsbB
MQNTTTNEKASGGFFYFLMCCAATLIILLPVGIANVVFGYVLLDSPCTLCWGQRIAMIFIGLAAFFVVRYGFKPRYLASILIFAGFGLFQSFRHLSMHSGRDLDQGFGMAVFGIHTYSWAEIVFWAVIVLLGIMLFFAPKNAGPAMEDGKPWRRMNFFTKCCFTISAIIIGSNALQAVVSTGLPPNYGQGDPVRFSWNPENIIQTPNGMKNHFKKIDFLSKRNVKNPDFAFAPNAGNLGITFSHDADKAPVAVDQKLEIVSDRAIDIKAPLNTLSLINGEYVVSSKFDVYFLNKDLKTVDEFEFDPYYSATIDPTVGVIPWKDGKFILMGSNKTFLKFKKSVTDKPKAELIGRYSDFVKGEEHFFADGRGRIDTVRSRFHHVMSVASDGKYSYLATVPNNLDKKKFVISKQLLSDMTTSGEFTPSAKLKDGRSLGELYVTGMAVYNGKLYAVSKNYNVIVEIDPASEAVVKVFSIPAKLTDPRGLIADADGFRILDNNHLITLK